MILISILIFTLAFLFLWWLSGYGEQLETWFTRFVSDVNWRRFKAKINAGKKIKK